MKAIVVAEQGAGTAGMKPGDVDFTVGASLPISGLTAWQGLTMHGRLSAGQRVMAHCAAGRARPRPRASGAASRAGPQPDIN